MPGPEPTAGRFEGRNHQLAVRIYYEDTDFSGVVYHANYLRYFERGRSDFLRMIGVSHGALQEEADPTAFAVVAMDLRFQRAARIDDALTVETCFNLVQGPRLLISQRISRAGEAIASADVVACCISRTGRAKKPPLLLMERLKPYLQP